MSVIDKVKHVFVYTGCEKGSNSYTWIYVLMGNMLRGIGETPIVPLGVSYIDDFAKEGNSSMYLGKVQSLLCLVLKCSGSEVEMAALLN